MHEQLMHARRHAALITLCLTLGCGGASGAAPGAAEPTPPSLTPETAETAAPAAAGADTASALPAILASEHRSEKNRARDVYRHPIETLTFFGIQPTQTVVELWPGGGWYTEVLAPLLREHGKLIAVAPTGNYLQPYKDFLAARPDMYKDLQLVEVTPPDQLAFGPDGSADAVVTFRNVHGWLNGGYAPQVMAAAFKVLKPGGVFGVVEHRGKPGMTPEEIKKSGYVPEQTVLDAAQAAGFVLEERSEVNANPKDTKDYPEGVWTLPPSLRLGDKDRDKYLAIGESDRMTFRFRKPAQ